MRASANLQGSFQGSALTVARTPAKNGIRSPLLVRAYQKNGKKVKGGYKGTEPNAKKGFCKVDSSGRKAKGFGAYRFSRKYGDINDYSPIYDEYTWVPGGDTYTLGTQGLTAWGGLLTVLLAVSVYLVVSTSQLQL